LSLVLRRLKQTTGSDVIQSNNQPVNKTEKSSLVERSTVVASYKCKYTQSASAQVAVRLEALPVQSERTTQLLRRLASPLPDPDPLPMAEIKIIELGDFTVELSW